MAVQPNRILSADGHPCVWFFGNASNLKTDPLVSDDTRWDAIPNTLLYNGVPGAPELAGKVGFVDVPHVYPPNYTLWNYPSPPEYVDAIGHPNYYWRSACYLLRLDKGSSVTVNKIATGWSTWTQTFGEPADPEGWDNGGLMYSTHNFRPLTNPKPKAPHKTITAGQVVNGTNGPDDPVKGVGIGDTVHYEVDQRVHQIGNAGDGLVKYERFAYSDKLPVYVKAKLDTVKVIDDYGNPLMVSNQRAPMRTDTSGVEIRRMRTAAIRPEGPRHMDCPDHASRPTLIAGHAGSSGVSALVTSEGRLRILWFACVRTFADLRMRARKGADENEAITCSDGVRCHRGLGGGGRFVSCRLSGYDWVRSSGPLVASRYRCCDGKCVGWGGVCCSRGSLSTMGLVYA